MKAGTHRGCLACGDVAVLAVVLASESVTTVGVYRPTPPKLWPSQTCRTVPQQSDLPRESPQ